MTKKRKIKSTLPSEPKPQFLRALVVVALAVVLAVGLGAVSRAQAATISVPADYATIQEAVDAAAPGDTIMVAPGEYAGAGILKTVKIIGSGTGTRITTGIPLSSTFPYGDAFDILYADAAGTEISNLEIEIPPSASGPAGIVMAFANNCTVKDVTIIGDSLYSAIEAFVSANCTITGNTISGTWLFGINASYWASWTDITANTVSGTGRYGINVTTQSNHTTVNQNTIRDFHSTEDFGAPIVVQMSSNCMVTNNSLIDVYYPDNYAQGKGPNAGIRIAAYGTWWFPCTDNTVLDNDYNKSGLPGWNTNHPSGPGCVLLRAAPEWPGLPWAAVGNYVSENHHAYPAGTTICEQILDMTATPENPDGDNTEVGMERCPEVSDYIDRLRD